MNKAMPIVSSGFSYLTPCLKLTQRYLAYEIASSTADGIIRSRWQA